MCIQIFILRDGVSYYPLTFIIFSNAFLRFNVCLYYIAEMENILSPQKRVAKLRESETSPSGRTKNGQPDRRAGYVSGCPSRPGWSRSVRVGVGLPSECPEGSRALFGRTGSGGGLLAEQSECTSDIYWNSPGPIGLLSTRFGPVSEQIFLNGVVVIVH